MKRMQRLREIEKDKTKEKKNTHAQLDTTLINVIMVYRLGVKLCRLVSTERVNGRWGHDIDRQQQYLSSVHTHCVRATNLIIQFKSHALHRPQLNKSIQLLGVIVYIYFHIRMAVCFDWSYHCFRCSELIK